MESPSLIRSQNMSFPHRSGRAFDASLAYIEQTLAEEDSEEERSSGLSGINPLALHAMEKSFYQALNDGQFLPGPANQQPQPFRGETQPSNEPLSNCCQYCSSNNSRCVNGAIFNLDGCGGQSSTLSDSELALLQFQRGAEEANKFLPRKNMLSVAIDDKIHKKMRPAKLKDSPGEYNNFPRDAGYGVRNTSQQLTIGEGIRTERPPLKTHEEDVDGLLELFEKLYVVGAGSRHKLPLECIDDIVSTKQAAGTPSSNKTRKLVFEEVIKVDLLSLLMNCARAISGDHKSSAAREFLLQIRQHSSPFGDWSQRLAHYFANALDSRLLGTGSHLYHAPSTHLPSVIDVVKATHSFVWSCPFRVINFCLVVHHISILAEKASTLHIIDFGIHAGYQCSRIIDHLSAGPSGLPPKIRITGIEDCQASEIVKKTGRRLAKHCERYNVRFEYNGIAQNWETIQIEDFKIGENEVVVVNCLLRFEKLLDEVVGMDSPRSAVLSLIRKINPDAFLMCVAHATYNTPLFFPRFREALFQYSSWFEMLEVNFSRDNETRFMHERCFFGREILNIVACEGAERVERAETYRQWQVRTSRAGFRQLPVDGELLKKVMGIVKSGYHKDFMIGENGHWILQGWKGRTLCASSCWVSA